MPQKKQRPGASTAAMGTLPSSPSGSGAFSSSCCKSGGGAGCCSISSGSGGTAVNGGSGTLFGYMSPTPPPGLAREVHKWLQGLGLSCPMQHPRRELTSGFHIAELLHHFYPDIEMYSFANGTSEPCRRGNWELLGRVAARHEVPLPAALVDGVQQGRPGAAEELLEALYCQITGKKVQKLEARDAKPAGINAAAAAAALPSMSFGEPAGGAAAAAAQSGVLRGIKQGGAAAALEFGVQVQSAAGDAATLRRTFAQHA